MKTEKKTEHLTRLERVNENKQNSVSLKKNTDGHQKTRYEKNIKCSDNTHLPPKEITKQPQHH